MGEHYFLKKLAGNSNFVTYKVSGENRDILIAHLRGLMSVHASATNLADSVAIDRDSNGCSRDNGGCSHLCLMTPKGA